MAHRKDQIIRNCVNPELGKHILDNALKNKEVKSGCDANDDGIPPNNKLLGILPNE